MKGNINLKVVDTGEGTMIEAKSEIESVSITDKLILVHSVMQVLEFNTLEENLLSIAIKLNCWPEEVDGYQRVFNEEEISNEKVNR